MNAIKKRAFAKVNLGLDVIRKLENGYHKVRMIMQSLELSDHITIQKISENALTLKSNHSFLPVNETNLVHQAAKLLIDEFSITHGLLINIEKTIPIAAGLAGGSSDAAATLLGINELLNLGLSKEDLMERGAKLGADVPYCILGGTALSEGIGEKLTPLPSISPCTILVVKPPFSVSTKFVYENLDLSAPQKHPDIDGIMKCLYQQDLNGISSRLSNLLETVTIKNYPLIQNLKDTMIQQGAMNALMSGSGPTVFGLFHQKKTAKDAANIIQNENIGCQVFLTNFLTH